jgi:hypothetical protein
MASILPFTPASTHAHQPRTLADKAMLVRLRRSMRSPYAYDSTATHQVEAAANATRIGRFNKHLMKNSAALKRCTSAFTDVYTYANKHTLPWLDDGLRLLPAHLYADFTSSLRQRIHAAEQEADNLALVWHSEINNDALRLGNLFNPNDYPDATEIRNYWSISTRFLPVPTTNDFRTQIDPQDVASLQQEIAEAEQNAASYVLQSMLEPMEYAVQRLKEYENRPGQRFHESIINNMVEVASRMEKVNISDDPNIAASIRQLKPLALSCAMNTTAIKENDATRASVRQQITDLTNSFAGLI